MGSLVFKSQSKAYVSGMRMTGVATELARSRQRSVISFNDILIIEMGYPIGRFMNKMDDYVHNRVKLRLKRERYNTNLMSNLQGNLEGEGMQQELDDLEELGLFHTSSLRDREDPPLQPVSVETYELKRSYGANNVELYNQYEVVGELGRGAFGQVLRVRAGGEEYAMKICSTKGLEKQRFFAADGQFANCLDVLHNELNILKRLSHKNIARCLEIIHGNDRICTINELGNLGQIMEWRELDDCFKRNPKVTAYIGEKYKLTTLGDITRLIFLEVCEGVKYMHDHNITNRDIKVDNLICRESKGVGDEVMIVDFTTVRFRGNDDISYFPTGTPGFRGPEHQFAGSDGYSSKATDVWAVGIAMWVFFHERMPFKGEDDLERDITAKNVQLQFAEDCPAVLVEAVRKMTRKDWKERISIDQALQLLQKSE